MAPAEVEADLNMAIEDGESGRGLSLCLSRLGLYKTHTHTCTLVLEEEYEVMYICGETPTRYLVAWKDYPHEPTWQDKAYMKAKTERVVVRWEDHVRRVEELFPNTPPGIVMMLPDNTVGARGRAVRPPAMLLPHPSMVLDASRQRCLNFAFVNCLKLCGLVGARYEDFVHLNSVDSLRRDGVASKRLVLGKTANRRLMQQSFPLINRVRGSTAHHVVASALETVRSSQTDLVFLVIAQPTGTCQHTAKHCLTVWRGGVLDPSHGIVEWANCAADWKGAVSLISPIVASQ